MANPHDQNWIVRPRVRLLGQPLGMGLTLTAAGGFLSFNMVLAINFGEHWSMVAITILLVLGFFAMFLMGIAYLLAPFEKVWISSEEVQLRLGSLVLRRIPRASIRSITPVNREVRIRRRECDLYRLKINCLGSWPAGRSLWLDWSLATADALKETLQDVTFLF